MVTAARFLFPLALALAACSQTAVPPMEASPPATAQGVTIAQLVTHDSKVAILGGRGGGELRVVVRKTDGTLVADGVTLSELRTRDPEIYEVVTSSYVDATLDLAHLN